MERLRKACQLSWADWLFLGQAWTLFLLVDLFLRVLPLRYVLSWCRRNAGFRRNSALLPSVERCAWLTTLAGRYHLVRSTCLKEALVLSALLGQRGVSATLRIGVSRSQGGFAAHAWVEQDGRIVLGLQPQHAFELFHLEGADPS